MPFPSISLRWWQNPSLTLWKMPEGGIQVRNGKAFEYAIALAYKTYLSEVGYRVELVDDRPKETARLFFESFNEEVRNAFLTAAKASISTILRLEAGFTSPKNNRDILYIRIAEDGEGEGGDVRDVIFSRTLSGWEVGFSAKNNNDAVKHSRLSNLIDFGDKWVGHSVSQQYWSEIAPVFDTLTGLRGRDWEETDLDKVEDVYKPLLNAFRDELMRLYRQFPEIPEKLITYLIGEYPFYKLIKDDNARMLIVKAYNTRGELNQTVNHRQSDYKAKPMNLPTRIVEFDYKIMRDGSVSDNTLDMIMDGGWEISFRIHNASSRIEPSLKFDIQLLGNPPVLFTQYLFAE